MMFENEYTMLMSQMDGVKRETIRRLAEIEQEDADRCSRCGGEDCICCEVYIDRQQWKSPWELFNDY